MYTEGNVKQRSRLLQPYFVLKHLGEGAIDPNDPNKDSVLTQLAKTEISLTLTNKFELLEGDDKDTKGLMMK